MFGFDDDEEGGFGFGGGGFGGMQQGPTFTAGGQPLPESGGLGGMNLKGLDPGMKMVLLSQMMQGGNPLQAVQSLAQMQATQQRGKYQEAMTALKQAQAKREEAYAAGQGALFDQQNPQVAAQASQGGQATAGQPQNPTEGGGDYGPDPLAQGGQQQPGAQQPGMVPQNDPRMYRVELYRKAADNAMRFGKDEAAKRYGDYANALEQQMNGEWSLPQTMLGPDGKAMAVQFNAKTGAVRPVQGFDPKRNMTAPTASADGMISMDQDTGQVQKLGVGAHEPTPAEIQQYQLAQQQGFKGSILDFKKAVAAAGSTKLTVENKIGNSLGQEVAQGLAKRVVEGQAGADAAANTLGQIDTIRQNVDKAITGTANEPRTWFARLKETVGLGNNATKEQLAATAATSQALASTELSAAEAMKGQGQITESERAIIAKAAAGKLNQTPEEIKELTLALEKVARGKIASHQRNVNAIRNIPDFKPLFPFMDGNTGTMPPGGPPITPVTPRGAAKPAAAQPNAQRQVARTGKTRDGRTVVEYTDGTREYR